MNNTRRKSIQKIFDRLEELMQDIEALQEEEQDCYDNLPESLQYGERGQAMQEAADNLEYAAISVQEALECLEEAMQSS